ncbi:condensation domain-containing protein, partial [Plantactinospora endophytica]
SALQEGLLFHNVFDGAGPDVYTGQSVFDLDGVVDFGLLRVAAGELIRRHSSLRSGFRQRRSGEWAQLVLREVEPAWREVDLRGLPVGEQLVESDRVVDEERSARFDLGSPPLVRFVVVRLSGSRSRFVVTSHHIAFDGWSLPVVVRDLFRLYSAGGDGGALPPVRGYRDFLVWLAGRDRVEGLRVWGEALSGLDGPTVVAPGVSRVAVLPREWEFGLSEVETSALVGWARGRGLTLNTVVEGVWGLVLGQLTGRLDVVGGVTVSGRPAELDGVESMVGLFINTVPLRVRVRLGESLVGLFERLQGEQAGLLAHQHVGLADVRAVAGLSGGVDLFDTLCVFQNFPSSGAGWGELDGVVPVVGVRSRSASHYPLALLVGPGRSLRFQLNYRPDVFTESDAVGIADRLRRILLEVLR